MMLTHRRSQDPIHVRFPSFCLSKTPLRLIFTVIVRKEMHSSIPIIFSWSAPSCFISCLISFTYVPILDFLGLFLLPLDTEPFFGDAEKKAVRRKNTTKTWILVIFAQVVDIYALDHCYINCVTWFHEISSCSSNIIQYWQNSQWLLNWLIWIIFIWKSYHT